MKQPRSFAFETSDVGSRFTEGSRVGSLREMAHSRSPAFQRPYGVTRLGASVAGPSTGVAADSVGDDPRLGRMRLEAILLLAKSPLSLRKLSQLAHLADATEARTLVRQLNQTYDTLGRAMRVEQVAGGFRLLTRPALAPWLARLGHLPPRVRLSTPMMETLAVVAYRQPVSRASAEAVRGVACGELLRQLMERDLIRIVGRGEELGRPYLYGTTRRFLQLFGLPSADALPAIQWDTLHEDPVAEDSSLDDLSTSTKEHVVSTSVAPVVTEADPEVLGSATTLAPRLEASSQTQTRAAIDDEEDEGDEGDEEYYEDEDEDEDWDEEEDDWDEEDLEDEELEDEELEDEELEDEELEDEELEDEELEDEELEDEDLEDEEEEDIEDSGWEEVEDEDDEDWDDEDEEDEDWDDEEENEEDEDWD